MKKLFFCFALMFVLIGQAYGEIIGTWYGISDRLITPIIETTRFVISKSIFTSSGMEHNSIEILSKA